MSMNERYEPQSIEPRWQRRWEEAGAFKAGRRPDADTRYVLEMFPYPSGAMHMGHARVYTIGDALARHLRMRGFDVLHPIGFDALGLPAENAAIKDGRHPAERTRENVVSFRAEMKRLGYSFDWERELVTADASYYRWNQWFFLKLLEKGIAYRRQGKVNWCTGCQTVIANEQVVDDNRCERCGSPVVEKIHPEWAFRITAYAQQLLDGLDGLKDWPDRVTTMQRNWIGKSEGAEVDFALAAGGAAVKVFTTRVDTIYGCTYVVLAPEHPLVAQVTAPERRAEVDAFVARMRKTDAVERTGEGAPKEGVFTGAFAVNPFTGEQVPIWIANFVLAEYGTGAVMSVPAHDQRDFEFARKYGLPVRVVIQPAQGARLPAGDALDRAATEDGVLEGSGPFTGLASAEARARMSAHAAEKGFGQGTVRWHLRDWGFSRQRYWGTPIPIIYCDEHGMVPVPEQDLPVVLPAEAIITGTGEPPLAKVASFVNTTCPRCGKPARREVETMDTFVDSSWYYARYLSPRDDARPFDPEVARRWLPVDVYVGGPEHAVMHLLYFRFWHRVMHELGLVHEDEPVRRLVTQGIVNGPDGRKMSKRWGNVVAPGGMVSRFGADTVRMFMLFAAPPEKDIDWSDEQVDGLFRFLARVWRIYFARQACFDASEAALAQAAGEALELRRRTHRTIKRVTEGLEADLKFNTSIAALMELVNALYAFEPASEPDRAAVREALLALATLLAPFAPHVAEELWHEVMGPVARERLVADAPWPPFDPALIVADTVTIAVQVNGKLRGEVQAPAAAGEAEVRALAEADEKVKVHLAGKTVRKVVFVPKRLVNFVVA
ncbi:leucyl-tRNA synthetase [Anaeromyxobacter dehalogenans 2CP-1]|uniref:Leucine--tRNA ligase n=1 Tax=Anaeromyxobacter dehalogenans (strain ATCC BAA-258 / DSM 21875 / 2CP-1) TaxID=455488 RepID=B8JEV2_ANAD2|nr:leucine--tRNA ligase [Anaeromyxobacter dehalogenans]ACL66248.1 leucyl-tRNA synthetase [Anaeromyxobacter dehalogenans 2CP-1]